MTTQKGLKHLISIDKLSTSDIDKIFNHECNHNFRLNHVNVGLLFYENSTRTRCSFELAAKLLGYNVINLNLDTSAEVKGETVFDTVANLVTMGINVLVIRHQRENLVKELVKKFGHQVHFVNAGNGCDEHPSQALIDYYTMMKEIEKLEKVIIIGDVLHSRVARSNVKLLTKYGIDLHLVGPVELLPKEIHNCPFTSHTKLIDGIKNANIVMCLRDQIERYDIKQSSIKDIIKGVSEEHAYKLTRELVEKYCPEAKIMHPGPVNRGKEITSDLVDDQKLSLILKQVENSVPVRVGIFEWLLN